MKESLLAWGLIIVTSLSLLSPVRTFAQDTAYTRVITGRAGKIVATLGITDSTDFYKIRALITDQYRALNTLYADRDAQHTDVTDKVKQLHTAYLAGLAKKLSPEQIVKVKDGMTYNILEVTYRAYQQELPDLTAKQKDTILADLTEARELAMDAESSEKKHQWFNKYKGRINNYLSSEGIDMKKAGEEWRRRIAAKKP